MAGRWLLDKNIKIAKRRRNSEEEEGVKGLILM